MEILAIIYWLFKVIFVGFVAQYIVENKTRFTINSLNIEGFGILLLYCIIGHAFFDLIEHIFKAILF
jgi:predicted membrane-bound dolichyl-phosphate-mannose-protein mannosyltransferase